MTSTTLNELNGIYQSRLHRTPRSNALRIFYQLNDCHRFQHEFECVLNPLQHDEF